MTSRTKINAQKFVANPGDQSYTKHCFVLQFCVNPYGRPTNLIAYADSLDDALEHCGEWIEANEPGQLANDQVEAAYNEAKSDGKTDDDAYEYATTDVVILDCSRYIASDTWLIRAEDPTREQLVEIFNRGDQ